MGMEKERARRAPTPGGAGGALHAGVRPPAPPLLRAPQLGVLRFDGTACAAAGRSALLVASYGAARKEARAAALEPVVDAIAAARPEADVYQAYTSRFARAYAREREGLAVPSVPEALEALLADGYTRVAVASLHLFPGLEYQGLVEAFYAYRARFARLVLGTPLLYWMGQEGQRDDFAAFAAALRASEPPRAAGEAALFMAHGTLHPSNAVFSALQARFAQAGWRDAFVYTLTGWPRLEHIVPRLLDAGVRRVALAPLMLTAGAHVLRDMAGEAGTSHRARLLAEGFEVEVRAAGLGERPAVRALFAARAGEAWDALRADAS